MNSISGTFASSVTMIAPGATPSADAFASQECSGTSPARAP